MLSIMASRNDYPGFRLVYPTNSSDDFKWETDPHTAIPDVEGQDLPRVNDLWDSVMAGKRKASSSFGGVAGKKGKQVSQSILHEITY